MSRYQKDLGDFGERAAAAYLQQCGCRILARNFRVSGGELDLVAETEAYLIFAEVKTRSSARFGSPSEAVDRRKQLHMRRAAEAWLLQYPTDKEVRFDVLEVYASFARGEPFLRQIHHIAGMIMEV